MYRILNVVASRIVPALADLGELRGRQLKDYEDQLDAVFCTYLAYYFWYWRDERSEVFGDTANGYILNPKFNVELTRVRVSQHAWLGWGDKASKFDWQRVGS